MVEVGEEDMVVMEGTENTEDMEVMVVDGEATEDIRENGNMAKTPIKICITSLY